MPDERLPKKVFYGELQVGKRPQGGWKKRYKITLKVSLKVLEFREQILHRIGQSVVTSSEIEQLIIIIVNNNNNISLFHEDNILSIGLSNITSLTS